MGSFGLPDPPPPPSPAPPVPSIGQVHADLALAVSDAALLEVGQRIARMVADAVAQGFAAGMAAANPPNTPNA